MSKENWALYLGVAALFVGLVFLTGNILFILPLFIFVAVVDFFGRVPGRSTSSTYSSGGGVEYSIIPSPSPPASSQQTGEPDYSIGPGLMAVVVVGGVVVGFMVLAVFAVAILSFL